MVGGGGDSKGREGMKRRRGGKMEVKKGRSV